MIKLIFDDCCPFCDAYFYSRDYDPYENPNRAQAYYCSNSYCGYDEVHKVINVIIFYYLDETLYEISINIKDVWYNIVLNTNKLYIRDKSEQVFQLPDFNSYDELLQIIFILNIFS